MGMAESFVETLRQSFTDLFIEGMPNQRKYRARWPDGSYVDIHQTTEPFFQRIISVQTATFCAGTMLTTQTIHMFIAGSWMVSEQFITSSTGELQSG